MIWYGFWDFPGHGHSIVFAQAGAKTNLPNPWMQGSYSPRLPAGLKPSRVIEEPCFLLSQRWDPNYRHFMLETLGHLVYAKHLVERDPTAKVVILEGRSADFVRFSVESVIPSEKVLVIPDQQIWEFHRPFFCTSPSPVVEHDLFMANAMIERASRSSTVSCPKKIFLDRRSYDQRILSDDHFHGRRILNKEILYEETLKAGFVTIEPGEKLGYHDQVRMVSEADVIVCEISAACDNVRFCKPGARFIVLYPRNTEVWAAQYVTLAKDRNVDLVLVCCGEPDWNVNPQPSDPWNYPWYLVDIAAVQKALHG